jgi:hypothetical protein
MPISCQKNSHHNLAQSCYEQIHRSHQLRYPYQIASSFQWLVGCFSASDGGWSHQLFKQELALLPFDKSNSEYFKRSCIVQQMY